MQLVFVGKVLNIPHKGLMAKTGKGVLDLRADVVVEADILEVLADELVAVLAGKLSVEMLCSNLDVLLRHGDWMYAAERKMDEELIDINLP